MAKGGKKGKEVAPTGLQSWLDDVAAYERAFKTWEGRVEKILKRYRDESRAGQKEFTSAHFNILWSNVQTLLAATFSRLPKPDVSRRYRDQDPVGRVAALLLERALEYIVQHYPEYRTAMKSSVLDRYLGARGTMWVRYEPHFKAAQKGLAADGDQVTEDVDTPDEELDYECVACDYVHWRDFGHSVARTWEEVPRVWRKVYLTRKQMDERFGEDVSKQVPLDADTKQQQPDKGYGSQDSRQCATVYEGWDKAERKAVWFSKNVASFLDEKDDPLGLEDVFPCPPPLYGTLTNDSLVPVPDFTLYQDQQNELDLLADRIDGLVKALKVCGGYDASVPELQRIFTEAKNGTLIPIKNWAAFAEKNGLQGALSIVDLTPIAAALQSAYEAFDQIKNQIYDLTGISDIIRGQTKANETATAQQIKGQYASLRLKAYQDEVAVYATGALSIMGQVICRKFDPATIEKISGADQLSEVDKEHVPAALALLVGPERMQDPEADSGPNPLREFRINIAADSMVYLDEQAEQEARVAFLGATGGYLKEIAEALQFIPPQMVAVMIPLLMEMLKFGVTGYRVGKTIEGSFDAAAEQLKMIAQQMAAQPQGIPPQVQEQMQAQQEQLQKGGEELQKKGQELHAKEMDLHARETKHQVDKIQFDADKKVFGAELKAHKDVAAKDEQVAEENRRISTEREGLKLAREGDKANQAKDEAVRAEKDAKEGFGGRDKVQTETLKGVTEALKVLGEQISELKKVSGKRKLVRDSSGRASHSEPMVE